MEDWETVEPGTGVPVFDNEPENFTPELYADIRRILAEGDSGTPRPTVGHRKDGVFLFYPETVNGLVGASETGKTTLALCVLADELFLGKSALVLDVDHNGAKAISNRLRSFGVSENTLVDTTKFRYASPEGKEELLAVIQEAELWKPSFVLIDSIGEVMSMFGANSNDPDQYRQVHRQVFTAFAKAGACVVAIDHEPKSESTAQRGASGTAAKKQAVDGALYRVTMKTPFTPGHGGKATLSILKDRHGAIREASPVNGKEPTAAVFHLVAGEATNWFFYPPDDSVTSESRLETQAINDANAMREWANPPRNIRDVQSGLKAAYPRAKKAWDKYRESPESSSVSVSPL